jgi:nuclear respiratory factor 1
MSSAATVSKVSESAAASTSESASTSAASGIVSSSTPTTVVRVVQTVAGQPEDHHHEDIIISSVVANADDDHHMETDEDDVEIPTADGTVIIGGSGSAEDAVASQLASAGPTGMAAAAAISSAAAAKKRKRRLSFETNPSIRKRQQTRLLRKLKQNIEELSLRVGQQAVVLVATPGKVPQAGFRAFGAKPLEDVVRNLQTVIMSELENALARQAPPTTKMVGPDPARHELPPLVIDGIPTPVEKMTQAQLRAFIPTMLKYSTGRGKPGWGKDTTRPPWWPDCVPWANVRMDARLEDVKQRISWTHALREIVTNCYQYHGREDLLPTFAEEEEAQLKKDESDVKPQMQYSRTQTVKTVQAQDQGLTVSLSTGANGQIIATPVSTGTNTIVSIHR